MRNIFQFFGREIVLVVFLIILAISANGQMVSCTGQCPVGGNAGLCRFVMTYGSTSVAVSSYTLYNASGTASSGGSLGVNPGATGSTAAVPSGSVPSSVQFVLLNGPSFSTPYSITLYCNTNTGVCYSNAPGSVTTSALNWSNNTPQTAIMFLEAADNANGSVGAILGGPYTVAPGGVLAATNVAAGTTFANAGGITCTNVSMVDGTTLLFPGFGVTTTNAQLVFSGVFTGAGTASPNTNSGNSSLFLTYNGTNQPLGGPSTVDSANAAAGAGIGSSSGSGTNAGASSGIDTNQAAAMTNDLNALVNTNFTAPQYSIGTNVFASPGSPFGTVPTLGGSAPVITAPLSSIALNTSGLAIADVTYDFSDTVWSTIVPLFRGLFLFGLTLYFGFAMVRLVRSISPK